MNPAAELVRRCAGDIRSAAILPAALLAALLAFVYGVVGPTLSPYHIDNPWFASMIHNAAVLGVERDTLLDSPPSQGLAGTVLFGKVFAAASAALLEVTGWSLTASRLVSSAYWAVAAGLWLLVARRLGLSRKGALLFVLMMALTKPFVLSAMVIRPETFILLLSALAAWSALKGREVLAGFVAMVAVETHPIGVVAIAFAGAVTMVRRSDPGFGGRLTRVAAGAAGGVVLYAVLHRGHLHLLRDVIVHGANPEMGRFFLLSYFARPGAYLYRLIEAPVVVAGIALAFAAPVRRGFPGVAWLALAAGCVVVLPLRGNPHYLVLVLPALMLPIAAAADRADRRSIALAVLCLYYVPVYLAAHTLNKDAASHRAWYPQAVAAAVPDDGRPVLGSPEEWWEFKNRRYHVAESGKEHLFADLESYYFIDNPWLFGRYRLQVSPSVRAAADDRSRSTVVGRICFMGGAARVLLMTAR